jgi:hypothetical protein
MHVKKSTKGNSKKTKANTIVRKSTAKKPKASTTRRLTYTDKKPTTNVQTKGKARQRQHSPGAKKRPASYARQFDPKF